MNENEFDFELYEAEFQEAEFEEYAENSRREIAKRKLVYAKSFVNEKFAKLYITKALRRYYRLFFLTKI